MKPTRNPLVRAASLTAIVFFASQSLRAESVYWDINGATAGAGATTAPSGPWGGTNLNWSTSIDGTATTAAWVTGNTAIFSAGTNATSSFTVTLSGTPTIGGLTVEEGSPVITGGTALGINATTTPFTINGATTTITSAITGAACSIAKAGSGTLTLNGVIGTTTGGLNVTAGTLVVGSAANTFTGGISIDGATAVLQMTAGTTAGTATAAPLGVFPGGTGYKTVALDNGGTFRPMTTYNSDVPSATNAGKGYVFTIGAGGATFNVGASVLFSLDDGVGTGTATTNAQLQGTGTLTKTGVGTLSLGNGTSNFSSFSGPIVVSAGTLTTGAVSTNPFGTLGSAAVGTTIASGAALDVKGVNVGTETLTISGLGLASAPAGAITNSSTTGGTAAGPIILAADTSVGGANGLTLSGVISGDFVLSKVGVGTTVLSGPNTFTGGVAIGNGSIQASNNSALGTGAVTLLNGGATNATRLYVTGGVTVPNSVTFGNVFGVSGNGVLQQTGTGQGRINGMISINGGPSAGGTFYGGMAVGNELVLGGFILSTATNLSQRDGRVVYAGGGSGWNVLTVTNAAIVGATDGIDTAAVVTLCGSGSASLDLNGFDQTLAGLNLGNVTPANGFTGTVNLGAKTLTMTGTITNQSESTQNVSHPINATTGGTLSSGPTPVTINLNDTRAADDLLITGANLTGTGFVKSGPGTLTLKGAAVLCPLTLEAGTLATGKNGDLTPTALTINALGFGAGATNLRMKIGSVSDSITTGALTSSGGTTTITVLQTGGLLANGTYPLINYTGTSPGLTGLSLVAGHTLSTLVDTGTAIAMQVTGNDSVTWEGAASGAWDGTFSNWKRLSDAAATDYFESDAVIFNDNPTTGIITIGAHVAPSSVTFNNTVASPYTVTGLTGMLGFGIIGNTGLTKTGDGSLTLETANAYFGATTVNAGTLLANFTAGTAIPYASALYVAEGATVTLAHNGGTFGLASSLSGGGTVKIDPGLTTAGNRDLANVTWNASAFTGLMRLSPTTGSMRMAVDNLTDIGSGPIEITNAGQLYINTANLTIPNPFTLTGAGFVEGAGTLGAIRTTGTTTLSGVITIVDTAKIGALGSTAVVTNTLTGATVDDGFGNLSTVGVLTFGGSINNTGSETLAITGNASGLSGLIVNEGKATSAAASITVNIGNGTATGTLGACPVSLKADGFKNAILRFDRSDGYTLDGVVTSAATATANEVRNFLDLDCTGTGFSDGAKTTTLGAATPAAGGIVRIGQTRANALATLSGSLTAEKISVATGQNNGILTIDNGAVINVNYLNLSEIAGSSGTVNQVAGSTVNVTGQVRVAHYGSETSTYNLSGGALTLTGASPTKSPSTAGAGAANATGDNNINGGATQTIHGGGVYLGNDGAGILNHTGGTLTTNWMVLDNRGASGAGTNMVDGIDRYNLSGAATVLNLRSTWGLIGRNDGSYAVSLGGGTIRVDTSAVSGSSLTIPLDAILDTVTGTTTTLDTVDAGSAFTLAKNVNGPGALSLAGPGGTNLSTAGLQTLSAELSGSSNLTKLGTGTTLLTGSMSSYVGDVTVTLGRLDVPASLTSSVTVGATGTLGGEPTGLASLTLEAGAIVKFDPLSAGTLTVGTLNLNGNAWLDMSSLPVGSSAAALKYTTKTGAGTLGVLNAANYRNQPTVSDADGTLTVTFGAAGKPLTWTGSASTAWNINTATNWVGGDLVADGFFSGDSVTFPEGGLNPLIVLTGVLAPSNVSVTSDSTNYTFTSNGTTNVIAGATGLTKSGTSTLTLAGDNTYSGPTSISGGVVSISGTASIGSGLAGNSLALSGGGKLTHTGTVNLPLGVNRPIAIGTGGGALVHNSATAVTVTIPGAISGSAPLGFQSTEAGGGTFSLTGDNSGYTGPISIDSSGLGGTTLAFTGQASVPTSGTITIGLPTGMAISGVNALNLNGGLTLPAATTLFTNVGTNANGLVRNSINSAGDNVINSPLKVTSTASGSLTQIFANGGTLTLNGPITEATSGSFVAGSVLFVRGVAAIVLNSVVNLPGGTITHTDAGTITFNSTGNLWASTAFSVGTAVLGATDALCVTAPLNFGQNDGNTVTFNMAGFNQTVAGLTSNPTAPGANTTGKVITSAVGSPSTLTITPGVDSIYAGTISGEVSLVKKGSFSQTLAGTGTYTGNVTVDEGTLVAGASNALGSPITAGRVITVNAGTTVSFTANNVFGNGIANVNLPAVILNGSTLSATRYNVLGELTLNGATLTQGATDGPGAYEGYQFRGNITVGGTAASTIASTNNRANHLGTGTQFTVPDVAAGADLIVSAGLKDPSADFVGTIGSLTKTGTGTLVLSGTNTYTGTTSVNAGTLVVNGASGSTAVTVAATATLGGSGTVGALTAAGTIAPGDGSTPGTLSAGPTALTGTLEIEVNATTSDSLNVAGTLALDTFKIRVSGTPTAASYTLATATALTGVPALETPVAGYELTVVGNSVLLKSLTSEVPYTKWATEQGLTDGDALPGADPDRDGLKNVLEFVLGGNPKLGDNRTIAPTIQNTATAMIITFKRSDSSELQPVAVTVQVSPDLKTWDVANDIVIGATDGTGPNGATYTVDETGDLDTVVVTIPKNSAKLKFGRVTAVIP